ncbi:MAG TPA: (Fe-S)-binding protein, partial [Rhodocyclaceae bacterium]|nr:(Fe-S)-binding protein [Rhodocyclaceae bacterium]
TSLQDGRYAALSMERLLQGASLTANRDNQGRQPTRLYVNVARHAPLPAVQPADPAQGYTTAEAQAEAARCFPCHCLECVQVCPYLEHYGAYPKRYIREIYNNETIVMGVRKSNRMIDSCTLCGLCAAVCPEQLGMGEVCLSARQGMVEKGRMPVSHHDFALRDLAFSRSDAFTLARHQPGFEASALLFYPGCQLAASSPDHVARIYAHLCERVPGGVGLMLGCCGAPAHWSARDDLFAETRAQFRADWERLGKPPVVTACSSCFRMFSDHQPDVPVESLWWLLERVGPPAGATLPARTLAIHDPCTTRQNTAIHASVRRLAADRGVTTVELDGAGLTTCCGFGGLAEFANREVADKIVDRRIGQNDADYLTYCAMCRDNFARRGKRAVHILDLLYPGDDPAARRDPGFSARQENRGRLKRRLLRELWGESMNEPAVDVELVIAPEVQADIEKKLILLDDIRQTVRHAETSGEKLIDRRSGRSIACHRPVRVTYWVEYTMADGRCVVHRAYSHRMELGAAS